VYGIYETKCNIKLKPKSSKIPKRESEKLTVPSKVPKLPGIDGTIIANEEINKIKVVWRIVKFKLNAFWTKNTSKI
tara:strand:+ start:365 stop:592 length:228 start_codon:yes stop_codon:yes gene_type:complete